VAANSELALQLKDGGGPAYNALVSTLETSTGEGELYLNSVFRNYVHTATISAWVGYRFK
jgi:hypothetical protein